MQVGFKAIATLTTPIFLANLAIVASGTIDTLMAGRLSAADLAGVALGMAIASWLNVSLSDILQGLSPIAGFYYGANKPREVGIHLYHNVYLGLAFSLPGMALMVATPMWMHLAGATGQAAQVASQYLLYAAVALPAILMSRGFVCTNAAVNRPAATMAVTLLLLAAKIPLNAMLMYGWWGVPNLGGAGAALASAIVSWVGLLLYRTIWHKDAYYAAMRPKRLPKVQWAYLAHQLKVGLPMGLAGSFEITAFSAMTLLLARLGDVVVGAHQIVANLVYIIYVLPFTVGIAGTILVAQSLGAGRPDLGKAVTKRVLGLCLVASLIVGAVVWLGRDAIVALYTDDAPVAAAAIGIMGWAALYHIVDAMQISATSLLRGYQITFIPMLIHAFMLCGVALGVGTLLAYGVEGWIAPHGLAGFWVGACVGLGTAALAIVPYAIHVAFNKAKGSTLTSLESAQGASMSPSKAA